MPRLEQISRSRSQFIQVPSMPWLNEALAGGFVRGAVYLLAGGAGMGKSTLVAQVLANMASRGHKVVYISTEVSLAEFRTALERVQATGGTLPNAIVQNFLLDDTIHDLDALASFFTRKVLPAGEEYHGVEVIAIDSLQGRGVSPNATRKYGALYQFLDLARAAGVITVLVSHVTKAGEVAGPQSLAHNVDAVLYIRRGFRQRPFFVLKNRFGPVTDPVVLVMDERGRLIKSPLSTARHSVVYAFDGMDEVAEAQAVVGLPKLGRRAELVAPFVPEKRVRQLVGVINSIPEIDISDSEFLINCYLPRHGRYCAELDLPLALALFASFVQRQVPADAIFVGEIDLATRVRPPEESYLRNLAALLLGPQASKFQKVYVAREAAPRLSMLRVERDGARVGDGVRVLGVTDLEEVLGQLWPDLMTHSKSLCSKLAG